MQNGEPKMPDASIHIEQNACGFWEVRGGADRATRSFRIREHAIAFGRARAFSTNAMLFLREADGLCVRQSRASMTYPLVLG